MHVHFDTDFGGDPDDACALARLLGSAGADFASITTSIDAAVFDEFFLGAIDQLRYR